MNRLFNSLLFATPAAIMGYFHPPSTSSVAFCILYPVYLYATNRFRFGGFHNPSSLPLGQLYGAPWFKIYMIVVVVVALALPLATLLFLDDHNASNRIAQALIPLFLQIALEAISRPWHNVPRVLVPIGFNLYRLGSLWTWVFGTYDELAVIIGNEDSEQSLYLTAELALQSIHFAIAFMNLVLWTYNLFVLLLWRVLPVYFVEQEDVPPVVWKGHLVPIPCQQGQESAKKKI